MPLTSAPPSGRRRLTAGRTPKIDRVATIMFVSVPSCRLDAGSGISVRNHPQKRSLWVRLQGSREIDGLDAPHMDALELQRTRDYRLRGVQTHLSAHSVVRRWVKFRSLRAGD